jgi:hypothetical protein
MVLGGLHLPNHHQQAGVGSAQLLAVGGKKPEDVGFLYHQPASYATVGNCVEKGSGSFHKNSPNSGQ